MFRTMMQNSHSLFSHGNKQTSQEHFTTIVYAKFGGQTECIMGNWKIKNSTYLSYKK